MANSKTKATVKSPGGKAATGTPRKKTRALSAEQVMSRSEEFRSMVAEAAYYRALGRGFAPGYEESDWLAAEAEMVARTRERE